MRLAVIQNRKDFKLGLGLTGFCLFLLLYLIPREVGPLNEAESLMPGLITGFILLLSILLTIKSVRGPAEGAAYPQKDGVKRRSPWGSIAVVIAIMAAYAWLLQLTGFVLTSLGAMVALFLVFGVRRWFPIAAITLVTMGGLYVCFNILLGIPLPVGTLLETFLE